MAILLSAMAPTLSYAMPDQQNNVFAEICSASGHAYSSPSPRADALTFAQDSKSNGGHSKSMGTQHCPYCLNHANAYGMPVQREFFVAPLDLSYCLPSLYYHAPAPLFVWASASPRAPPVRFL